MSLNLRLSAVAPSPTALPEGFESEKAGSDTGRTLVVIAHGWGGSPDGMSDVRAATRKALATPDGLDVFTPPLPYMSFFSFASPDKVVARLLSGIDQLCADIDRYAHIYLVGH